MLNGSLSWHTSVISCSGSGERSGGRGYRPCFHVGASMCERMKDWVESTTAGLCKACLPQILF